MLLLIKDFNDVRSVVNEFEEDNELKLPENNNLAKDIKRYFEEIRGENDSGALITLDHIFNVEAEIRKYFKCGTYCSSLLYYPEKIAVNLLESCDHNNHCYQVLMKEEDALFLLKLIMKAHDLI